MAPTHIIVLDEPTNFLDRESLAALIKAIESFQGGVAIITHSREFSEGTCKEIWAMGDGVLTASGHDWTESNAKGTKIESKDDEEDKFDALGNKIAATKKEKKVTSSDKRRRGLQKPRRRRLVPTTRRTSWRICDGVDALFDFSASVSFLKFFRVLFLTESQSQFPTILGSQSVPECCVPVPELTSLSFASQPRPRRLARISPSPQRYFELTQASSANGLQSFERVSLQMLLKSCTALASNVPLVSTVKSSQDHLERQNRERT